MLALQSLQNPQQASFSTHLNYPIRSSSKPRQSTCYVTFNPSVSTKDTDSNNRLIQSFCKQGNLEQALHLLSDEPSPTQLTYELLILSCTRQNSLSDGLHVHRHILDAGFDQDPFLATKLINMYSELDAIDNAREVFDKTRNRTIYVWNALFRALTLVGHGLEVLKLYRRMNTMGVQSDRFTYTYVLKACVAAESLISLLMKGKEIHSHILRRGYEAHVHVMTTLLDMYARFGCVSSASYVFDEMPAKNVVSWSAMIACYAKNGRPFEALELFREMMLNTQDSFPNSVTMVSVLQGCAALASLEQGKLIHGYMLRRGLDSILPVISALVTMYARCGKLDWSQKVFDLINNRDVVLWNSLISSYGVHGYGKKAIELFNEMIDNRVSPSYISFVSVLGACSHSGLVEEGKELFESMAKKYGIYPSVEHYACMVDLLGRANRFDEATKVIENMRIEPGPKVWGSLLGSCRIHCNVELAERACKRLFELEPTNAGNYVLLANIYAEANMWDGVGRVRKLLENHELQKVPGRSWIEVKKKIHSFVSVDDLNPQVEELHALLLKLSNEMKDEGYVPQTKIVLYDLDDDEKERIVLGHSEKLAVAFGLINTSKGETIRITKNLRLCEDCHSVTKFISKFANREILVRDVNRFHHFQDGVCSCEDYWYKEGETISGISLTQFHGSAPCNGRSTNDNAWMGKSKSRELTRRKFFQPSPFFEETGKRSRRRTIINIYRAELTGICTSSATVTRSLYGGDSQRKNAEESVTSAMKSKTFCFCIPSRKSRDVESEASSTEKSSKPKSRRGGNCSANDPDHADGHRAADTGGTETSGVAVAVAVIASANIATVDAGEGSAHGGEG